MKLRMSAASTPRRACHSMTCIDIMNSDDHVHDRANRTCHGHPSSVSGGTEGPCIQMCHRCGKLAPSETKVLTTGMAGPSSCAARSQHKRHDINQKAQITVRFFWFMELVTVGGCENGMYEMPCAATAIRPAAPAIWHADLLAPSRNLASKIEATALHFISISYKISCRLLG